MSACVIISMYYSACPRKITESLCKRVSVYLPLNVSFCMSGPVCIRAWVLFCASVCLCAGSTLCTKDMRKIMRVKSLCWQVKEH